MTQVTLNRQETTALPFTITDSGNSLAGKRVTWAVENSAGVTVLSKASATPGSSAAVTVSLQTPSQISGTINLTVADYAALLESEFHYATLWVDDGAGNQRCATVGGRDLVVVTDTAARS